MNALEKIFTQSIAAAGAVGLLEHMIENDTVPEYIRALAVEVVDKYNAAEAEYQSTLAIAEAAKR